MESVGHRIWASLDHGWLWPNVSCQVVGTIITQTGNKIFGPGIIQAHDQVRAQALSDFTKAQVRAQANSDSRS
jgi:hypothetical protein